MRERPAGHPAGQPREGSLLLPFLTLAALVVIILTAILAMVGRVQRLHEASVRDVAAWSFRSERLGHLSALAAAVNAPGNDVFISWDVARESARLDSATAAFAHELAAVRVQLRRELSGEDAERALGHLVRLEANLGVMAGQGRLVLEAIRTGREDLAGAHMAAMDRAFEEGSAYVRALRADGDALVRRRLAAQQAEAARLRQLKIVLAVGAVILVAGIALYARRLIRNSEAQAEQQASQLRALSHREAELEESRAQLERRVNERTAELSAQHDFLRQIIDTIPHFVFAKDRGGRFTLANASVAAAYGVSPDELVGKSDADFNANPEELARFRRDDLRVLDRHESRFIAEESITDATGARRWLQTVKRPVVGPDGRATFVLGVSTDITALRAAAQRSQQLAAIVQASDVAIFSVDLDETVVTWNPAAEALYGYSAAEVVGTRIESIVAPEGKATLAMVRGANARGDRTIGAETIGRRKDGSRFDASLSVVPLRNLDGTISGHAAFVRNITEQKRSAAALRERESQLAEAQQVARLGSFSWDIGTGEVRWSDEMFRLLGHEPGAVQPSYQEFIDAVHPDDVAFVHGEVDRSLTTLQPVEYEFRHRRADGEIAHYGARVRIATDASGRPVRMTGTAHNITDRKRIEAAEREAREAAEAASRAKSEFVANMSHEIRTPMNGVMGMLELVLTTRLSDQQRDFLESAWSSAESLLGLINDILDFSKIEAGRMVLDAAPFDVRTTVARTLAPLAMRASEKRIKLSHVIHPDVPAVLVGDSGRLRQVLVNLVGNAVKFTAAGSVEVRMAGMMGTDDDVVLSVAVVDTGIGIAHEKQALIFEAFQQADASTSREFGGSGLGLAISARLVELLGGTLTLESTPGVGSEFRFTCRMKVGSATSVVPGDDTLSHAALRHGAPADGASLQTLRILVAEDNPVNQKLARALLEQRGHEVVTVADGRAAVDAVQEGRFDVVIMDVQMPRMSGLEATRAVRDHERRTNAPRTPIIAFTAGAMKGDREACLEAGMDAYVAKPLRSEQLFAEIDRLVGATRADDATERAVMPPAGPTDQAGVGDVTRLLHVVGGDRTLLRELTELFASTYPRHLADLRAAIDRGDLGAIRDTAHSVKGSTASLTAARAAEAARQLEHIARDGEVAALTPALRRLEGELSTLHRWLMTIQTGTDD